MISRQWRGLAKFDRSADYVEHLRKDTIPILQTLPGFVDVSILQRNLANGIEFLIVTRWQSLSAIEAFSGRDIAVAVVPDNVKDMMVECDRTVSHYDVLQ